LRAPKQPEAEPAKDVHRCLCALALGIVCHHCKIAFNGDGNTIRIEQWLIVIIGPNSVTPFVPKAFCKKRFQLKRVTR
jgi:hypothetical protein